MPTERPPRNMRVFGSTLPAAIAVAWAASAVAQGADTAGTGAKARVLDRVTVTGTRIKRIDLEQALPVSVIRKQDIERAGITSAEQLLMFLNAAGNASDNLASNASIVSGEQRGNNGVSGANLRGQGADATLVLLNGRRVAAHGLKARAVDLNAIPFAAIERVEVLRDGASAIYGTDAIGGVINFITRSDYRGAQASFTADVTEAGGGHAYRGSLLAGGGDLASDGWNLMASLSLREDRILRGSQRDFSNGFQPERGLSPDTRGTPFATVFAFANSLVPAGGLVDPAGTAPATAINVFNLPGAAGCEAAGERMGPYDFRLWGVPGSRYACAWDYPAAAVIQQPLESIDFIGRATFLIGDAHEAYVEVTGSRVDVVKQFEPNQISSSAQANAAFDPSTWYPSTAASYDRVYDALAAHFGPDQLAYGMPIAYRWRCSACGPRAFGTVTDSYRVLAGMKGLWGDRWEYDLALLRGSSQSETTLISGYHYLDGLRSVLGQGLLDPFLPPGQPQSDEAMAALRAASADGVVLYGGESNITQFDASVAGELDWSLRGGPIMAAFGTDLRREDYRFEGDRRADARPVFNAPFDNQNALADASRRVWALFAEFRLPVTDALDLSLAGRHDHYDGFGATTNPKVSFKYRPFESLVLRGAYSTGFRVPTFNQLFNGLLESPYTGLDLADPERYPGAVVDPSIPGCEAIHPVILTGGREDLAPETSRQKGLGLVWAPTDHFNLSVDWWEIERVDTIRGAPREVLIQYYDVFRDNWIRDASGAVVAIDQRFINSGGSLTRGIEIDADLRGELAGGHWVLRLNGSYIDSFRTRELETLPYSPNRVGEYVRYFNLPLRWKHTLDFTWSRGDWAHSLTQIHRAGYRDEAPVSVANGSYIPPRWIPEVGSYTRYTYALWWSGIEDLRLGFTINNLLDRDPPFTAHQNDFAAGAGWEPRVADPRGRAFALNVEYLFD